MLIRFNVSNFLSFRDETEFNMLTGSFRNHEHHIYHAGKVNVLKGAAIYGANGAGKSNLIKAIHLLQKSVVQGSIPRLLNEKKFKLDKRYQDEPTSMEIEFSVDNTIYSYGMSFNNNIILEEWLYESGINIDDKLIFERTTDGSNTSIKVANKYQKTQKGKVLIEVLSDLLGPNELLISKAKSLNVEEIFEAKDWIEYSLLILYPDSKYSGLILNLSGSKEFRQFTNELLQTFDTGVNALNIQQVDFDKYFGDDDDDLKKEILEDLNEDGGIVFTDKSGGIYISMKNGKIVVEKVISVHKDSDNRDINFELEEESDGTLRLLDFIPAFANILQSKSTLIIDEIDQSLHPSLLNSLVTKIMGDKTSKGQFIFTTHESNLLDLKIFRQDEIWFAEKDKKSGSTQLYPLSDFKPRNDLDIRKGYLNGRFGAIPFLTHLEDLNWQTHGT